MLRTLVNLAVLTAAIMLCPCGCYGCQSGTGHCGSDLCRA